MKLLLLLAAACLAQDFDRGGQAAPAEKGQPPAAEAGKPAKQKKEAPQNVILITWDGVRTEDFFSNKPDPALEKTDTAALLPKFWGKRAAEGTVWGDPSGSFMISNLGGVSLPGYQSLMIGAVPACLNNDCGRVKEETFPERLVRELSLPKAKVAVIAAWDRLALAAEKTPGSVHVDAGSGGKTRDDLKTWPVALAYLDKERPRFLYISLNDSDDLAHAGDYPGYMARLRLYDDWLDALLTKLDSMGEYGQNTTVLLTTDHGRGLGQDWRNHNSFRPSAVRIWLYARGPRTSKGKGAGPRAHADVRPTVETLLGLAPQSCGTCGSPLPEVTGQPAANP